MSQKNQVSAAVSVGIISLFIISMGTSYMQPLMARLGEFFPTVGPDVLTYANSMAFLGCIVGPLVAGALTGKRLVGYKALAVVGSALFCIAGVIPVFWHSDFMVLVVTRFFVGVGAGFMTPLANPLINAFYEGDKLAKMLSFGTAAGQAGAMIMQLLAGTLGDISFWFAFFAPALSILSLIGALFLVKEPSPEELPAEEKGEKGGLPGRVWYCAVLLFVTCIAVVPILFNYSFFVARITDSLMVSSMIQVCYTIGMIIGGLLYAVVYKICGRFSVTVAYLLCVLGICIFMFGETIPLFVVGQLVLGIGNSLVIPAVLQVVGMVAKPSMVGFATSIVMVFMNLASFLGSPFISFIGNMTGDAIAAPIWVGVGIFIALAVVCVVISPYPKQAVQTEKSDR